MSVLPPRPKGPPLNAMRAFEAASRHNSFVVAAEELNVTPGAVSQHIKSLETWADVALFRRNPQGVTLTAEGHSLVKDFVAAFDALATATHTLRNLRPQAEVHIATLPSVAQLWLSPRLGKIRARFPQLSISVTATESPPRLSRELFDLSLFFAVPDSSSEQIELSDDTLIPVCAPKLAARIAAEDALDSMPLLHDQTWHDDWEIWSKSAGVALDAPHAGPRFSLYGLAVEEAKSGAGVLMGHTCLIGDALKSRTLVPVHDITCPTGRKLVANLPHKSRRRAEFDDVVDLLQRLA